MSCHRSDRRYAGPHPQCAGARQVEGGDAGLRLRERVLDVLQQEGFIRGYRHRPA